MTPEMRLAHHERTVLAHSLEQTKRTLAALEARGAPRHLKQMVRATVHRLELDMLDARCRANGLPVPPRRSERGRRERAVIPAGETKT